MKISAQSSTNLSKKTPWDFACKHLILKRVDVTFQNEACEMLIVRDVTANETLSLQM